MPIYRWLPALVPVLLILGAVCGPAELVAAVPPRFSIQTWETDEGLPNRSVVSMAQTPDGYLWLGTLQGLARFDGVSFKVFDQENTPALKDNRILHLFADSRGTLWIGTEHSGTLQLRADQISAPTELSSGGSERRLMAACEDASGAVWLYNANGEVWRYAQNRFTPFIITPHEESRWRTIIQETNGPVWVGTMRRQFAIGDLAEHDSLALPTHLEINAGLLNSLVPSARGGYWRLGLGIQKWTTNRLERDFGHYPGGLVPTAACEDREGNLIIGTQGLGVFIIGLDGAITSISTNHQLSHNWIQSLLVDHEGTLWVGTDGGGLNRVRRQSFNVVENTTRWSVRSVTEDAAGDLWIGTVRDSLGHWVRGTNQLEQLTVSRSGHSISSVYSDRSNRLWIATAGGELLLREHGRPDQPAGGGLIQGTVRAIHEDRSGRLWFGSSSGLASLRNAEWKKFTTSDGLGSDQITAITDAPGGLLWVGTARGGLYRLEENRFTEVQKPAGQAADDIRALWSDNDDVLWATTSGNGLLRFKGRQSSRFTVRDGLPSNRLGFIIEDREANLWIGSSKGLLRLARRSAALFAEGHLSSLPCRTYRKEDGLGLPTSECATDSQPGAWLGRDGTLWFATAKGLVSANPAQLRPNTNPPPVNIELALVDDVIRPARDFEGRPALVLHPGDERLHIHYSSLNLGPTNSVRFRHRLEGYQKDWSEAGNDRVAKFLKLTSGRYTFHVMAANEDGVWNEIGSTLAVIVRPPFWSTWWFLGAAAVAGFGLVAGIVHFLSTQKLERQLALLREKEVLEKERARIARDIHDQVGASLTQVALLGELVQTDKDSPGEVLEHAQQISLTARETTRALDEIVWTVNPQNDTLEGLVNYICKYAQDYLAVAGVRYRFDIPAQVPARAVAPEVRHNVFLASKEAVTNIVRHAQGSSAWLRIRLEPASVVLEIEDNGRGVADLDVDAPRTRNGLKNMRKRLEDIGGSFSLTPGPEGGALVRLTFPLT